MDLLEKFAQKKKKTLVLTNVGKRAVGGGYYIPARKGRKKKNPGIIQYGEKGSGGGV